MVAAEGEREGRGRERVEGGRGEREGEERGREREGGRERGGKKNGIEYGNEDVNK